MGSQRAEWLSLHFIYVLFKKYLFIYLSAPDLSCIMQDLLSSSWHAGFLTVAYDSSALGAQCLSHWTSREPRCPILLRTGIWQWVSHSPPLQTPRRSYWASLRLKTQIIYSDPPGFPGKWSRIWLRSSFTLFIYFLLYNIVLVLPYINMTLPQVYTYHLI